ncbi:DUF3224 domain-containing protein [Pendulispora brunnea]|uniref:DUF3224 domain-containing protein n=1 Tax=Pendulispora brunnea TaxID=2905690 RepID=A0ABZ2K3Z5_9BACT
MSHHARGQFHVTKNAQPPYDTDDGVILGRTTIQKQFEGDLEGTSVVEMLSAIAPVPESMAYVAIERVRARLHGKSGSFVLQHTGSMNRGASSLTITVVPDTGTEALKGIAGSMTIDFVDGQRTYAFDYTLAD